jgi:hypothetical protein
VGKTSAVLQFIHGKERLRKLEQEGALATATPAAGHAGPAGPLHYVCAPPDVRGSAAAKDGRAKGLLDSYPKMLVITEYAADALESAMQAAATQADALLLMVDPTSKESIDYFLRAVEFVSDFVLMVST